MNAGGAKWRALAIIRNCPLLMGLAPQWQERLADAGIVRTYPRGTRIFSQGDPCPGLFVVGDGLVRLFKVGPGGREHVLHFADAGKTFAEVAALGEFAVPANAETVEDTVLWVIATDRLMSLLNTHHDLCRQLLRGMSLWVRQLVGLLEDLVLRDASGRVAARLLEFDPGGAGEAFVLPMLKKDLANHLNLTSETLSRTLRRLQDAGLVELVAGHRVRIVNAGGLHAVAEGMPPAEFEGA